MGRFLNAAAAPWRGVKFLVQTPAAWPYALVAVVIATTLIGAMVGLAVWQVPGLVGATLPQGDEWYIQAFRWVAQVLATITAITLAIVVGGGLAQPLAGPALERLVRLRERAMGLPERPAEGLLVDLWRSTRSALIGLLSLPVLGLLSVIGLIPGVGVVMIPVRLVVVAIFISWDLLDYPLSVRGWGLRERLRWLGEHKTEVLGFGLSLALVFLVPCVQFLLLPAGVVGATALVAEIEAEERARQAGQESSGA